jgi:hypothetical protein
MASFCGKCGAPLAEQAAFCGSCGARKPAPAQATQPIQQSAPPPPGTVSTPPAPAIPATSNVFLKVVIAVVAVLGIGGLLAIAGIIYAAHKVTEKAHAVTRQALGDKAPAASGLASLLKGSGGSDDDRKFKGDPCRFLSTEDVSHAAGIAIIRAVPQDESCTYIAHGDPADMTSKHMASMLGSQVAAQGQTVDPQTQKMMQQITGVFFKQQESSDKRFAAQVATGEVPILTVGFATGNAELQMKMNRAAFRRIGATGTDEKSTDQHASGDLPGIGDDAFEMGGTGLMVRKGNVIAQFMFPACPCSADAIKPLAEKVASQL